MQETLRSGDMTADDFRIGSVVLNGRYEVLQQVKGYFGGEQVRLGTKGRCRYCGTTDPAQFRSKSHTFPEALGNKWVVSRDECDTCNKKTFSQYDDELAKAISPFLTLGGVKGKDNKTRQTGRSSGMSTIEERRTFDGRRSIMMGHKDVGPQFTFDPGSDWIQLRSLIAPVPFKPRYAYKALAKIGLALLPDEELPNYAKLTKWILDPRDTEEFPILEVAMSFGSVENAPPLVTGQLLRRTSPTDVIPHILLVFCAGSVCLQIDLMSDRMEDHLPPVPRGCVKIQYANVLGDDNGKAVRIAYSNPVHLNWSSPITAPQPIEAMVLDFNQRTCEARFTPVFRK